MANTPRRHIRSLAAIFAFEAAGRHRNFTAAAAELGVTQAAVSKQIAALEADLGMRLFDRGHREVRLSQDGQALFAVATKSLGALGDTLARLRASGQRRPLTIGATLTMSRFWLLPRLPALRARYPDVQIRVMSQDEPIVLGDGGADMVIRFGDGRWQDGTATPLFGSAIYPMASPGFLRSRAPLTTAEDILELPLIDYDAPDLSWASWADWLQAASLPVRRIRPELSFSRYLDAIEAATADQGVILVWGGLTGGMEERGALLRLPGPVLVPSGDFYLVSSHDGHPADRIVTDWIVEEAHRHANRHAGYRETT
jgi:LysR family glycine cleavage system transcriptional activator